MVAPSDFDRLITGYRISQTALLGDPYPTLPYPTLPYCTTTCTAVKGAT